MSEWFIPELEDFPSQRALLHLGLNNAVRYYRELVVPGIGGAWFVRQLSWAAAAIALAKEFAIKPAKIANGIEAYACKLEWEWDSLRDKNDFNRKGIRAFNRDGDNIWSFRELSDKKHYVQITYRMSSVRALIGLGLAEGSRFNTMELLKPGYDLAKAFLGQKKGGRGGKNIENALRCWIKGSKTDNIVDGLKIDGVTADEKIIIRDCLLSDSSDKFECNQRRKYLIEAFGRNSANAPTLNVIKSHIKQPDLVNNIETAIAFDAMLECSRTIIRRCAETIEASKLDFESVASDFIKQLKLKQKIKAYNNTTGKKNRYSESFATELLGANSDMDLLKCIVKRDGNILELSNAKIVKGKLFDRHKVIDESNSESADPVGLEESSTEIKIRQLFKLWRDCQ